MTPSERSEKIHLYGDAHRILTEALDRFPSEMWRFKPSATDWSIHEIVLHITDSEANSYVRARRIIAEPGLHLMAYDENKWGERLDYHHLDTADAIELFRWLRGLTHKLIQTLPENTWTHRAFHPEIGSITLEDWLNTYASHVPDHIGQMEAVFEAWQSKQA